MIKAVRTAFIGAGASLAIVTQAHALNTRTWVSGKGVDQSSCGQIAAPCRTLQYAHDNTTAGGEIDVLDPAGYGSLIITKGINIINDGVGVAGVLAPTGQNAITINAGTSEAVVLRGLTIEGSSVGANGIEFRSGGPLTVRDCSIQGFVGGSNTAGNGILLDPTGGTSNILITNTTVSNNDYIGVSFIPGLRSQGLNTSAVVSMDRVTASRNKLGIAFFGGYAGSGQMDFNISNSYITHNQQTGLQFTNSTNGAQIDHGYFESNLIAENGSGFSYGGGGKTGTLVLFISNNKIFLNSGNDLVSPDSWTVVSSAMNNYISQPGQKFTVNVTMSPN